MNRKILYLSLASILAVIVVAYGLATFSVDSHVTTATTANSNRDLKLPLENKIILDAQSSLDSVQATQQRQPEVDAALELSQSEQEHPTREISEQHYPDEDNLWEVGEDTAEVNGLPFAHPKLDPSAAATLSLQRDKLVSLRLGDRLTLPLPFENENYSALVIEASESDTGIRSLVAKFEGFDPGIGLLLTIGARSLFGSIVTPNETYLIEGDATRTVIFPGRLIEMPMHADDGISLESDDPMSDFEPSHPAEMPDN